MTTETETITITVTPDSNGLYQAYIGGEPCGTARKGVGEAARVDAATLEQRLVGGMQAYGVPGLV